MQIKYLGTAAAEAIPALFCHCAICEQARQKKGKEIRARTNVLIDELMIDFSPDAFYNMVRYDLDYGKLEHLLITHSHVDHFDAAELVMRNPGVYSNGLGNRVLHLYGNAMVGKVFKKISEIDNQGQAIAGIQFHELTYGVPVRCGSFTVTALKANHKPDEDAMIYLLEKEGKHVLYAHDTGELDPSVYAYLKQQHITLDFVSLDCTCDKFNCRDGHMGFENMLKVRDRLKPYFKTNTTVAVSHFSHNGKLSHSELESMCQKHGIAPTYDGIVFAI